MAVDAGSIYSEIRIQLDSLNGDIQKVQASFDKLGTNLGQTSEKTKKKIGSDLQQINLAHVALFAAIGLAIKKFISGYAEFEQSLANVQSVSRASAEDMAILEKAASKAGQTTKFSGKQAADAMYYLASAGFTARQSVEALDGVLSLASATGADLAFTAETVASAISQFGLEAKDSEKVANVFAMGIANSQATIDKLAVSMRYVGPVANAFKMTIEDTVGVLQILYNAGFEASQAGTALRSVLADLSNAASPAVDKLEKMGINFEKVNPAMVGFSDIIRNLNPIATDAGKIMQVFGDRAGPVMIKLLKEGGDQIDIYTKQVTDTNQAANAAAIQNDTLQFAMGRLNKSFTSVGKSIVSEFAPGMKVAANFLADLFFKFSQLPAPIKIFIGTAGGLIAAITGISAAINLFSSALGASTLPILAVTGGIAGLVAISSILYKAYNQTKDNTIILKKTQGDLENSTNTLKESIDKYKKANDELNDKTKDLNETELATLEIRKRLAGLEVLANLGKTLKAIENFDKALKDQNNSVLENQRNYSNAAKGLVTYEKEVERLTKLQDERNKMSIAERNTTANVTVELAKANQWLKTYEESTRKSSTALAESQLALANANKSRQEQIDILANALNLGQIQIKDIEVYNKLLAKEIQIRATQLKTMENQTEGQKGNNNSKKTAIVLTAEEIEANKQLQKTIEKTNEDLEDLNATSLEKIELDRNRAKAEVDLLEASEGLKKQAKKTLDDLYDAKKRDAEIDIKSDTSEKLKKRAEALKTAIEKYNEERKKQQDIDDKTSEKTDEYIEKLKQLENVNYDLIEAEKQKAIKEIEGSEASAEAQEAAKTAITEYYDALKDKTAADEFKKNMQGLAESTLSAIGSLATAFADLGNVQAESQIESINTIKDAQLKAIDEELQAKLEAAGVAEKTAIQLLQEELAAAIAAGDTELATEKQKELTRETLIQDANERKKLIEEKAAKDSAMISYKAAHAAWVLTNLSVISEGALAVMKAWSSAPWPWNIPAVAATGIQTGILLAKQAITEPKPPAMQSGGIVLGSQMRGTPVMTAENGSNELLLNDSDQGQNMIKNFARSIANEMGGGMNVTVIIQQDSKETARAVANVMNNGIVTLKQRAIV